MSDTLILDRNWMPVGFCQWTTAVKLWYEGVATIVKEDEAGKVIHSPSFTMGLPRVIVVKNAWKRRVGGEVPFSRRNIAIRDHSECQYCGRFLQTLEYTLEHVVPRSLGGKSSWTNLVLACQRCNTRKANMTLAQSGMKLLHAPVKPMRGDKRFHFKLHVKNIRPEWSEYQNWFYAENASWAYWNVSLEP